MLLQHFKSNTFIEHDYDDVRWNVISLLKRLCHLLESNQKQSEISLNQCRKN